MGQVWLSEGRIVKHQGHAVIISEPVSKVVSLFCQDCGRFLIDTSNPLAQYSNLPEHSGHPLSVEGVQIICQQDQTVVAEENLSDD
jgi:hypothetical protein